MNDIDERDNSSGDNIGVNEQNEYLTRVATFFHEMYV